MKKATVADLRNHFRRVSAWIEQGETVQIVKRGKPFAQLIALPPACSAAPKPDMMKQMRSIWGSRSFSDEEVRAMREAELAAEEG